MTWKRCMATSGLSIMVMVQSFTVTIVSPDLGTWWTGAFGLEDCKMKIIRGESLSLVHPCLFVS